MQEVNLCEQDCMQDVVRFRISECVQDGMQGLMVVLTLPCVWTGGNVEIVLETQAHVCCQHC